jgi:hypothetical protein
MGGALAWATLLIQFLPLAIQGVNEAIVLIGWGTDKIQSMVAEGRDPTDAEWLTLNTRTQALRSLLHSD